MRRTTHNNTILILLLLHRSSWPTSLWHLHHLRPWASRSFWKFRCWDLVDSFLDGWGHGNHWTIYDLSVAVNIDIIRFCSNSWTFRWCLALNRISDILNWAQTFDLTRSLIRSPVGRMSVGFVWANSSSGWGSLFISSRPLNNFKVVMIGKNTIPFIYNFIGLKFSLDHGKITCISILVFGSDVLLLILRLLLIRYSLV